MESHPWNVAPDEAVRIQERLRHEILLEPLDVDAVRLVAGADISFDQGSDVVYAGIVVLRLPDLQVVERAGVRAQAAFPYVPGLLSFREIPPLLAAWRRLSVRPDALICDGQGLAHPRRFGLACHLGLTLDVPAVGCAKSLLVGRHAPPDDTAGAWAPLVHRNELVGAALRTRAGVSPVFVSAGHRANLESALALVLRCTGRTRLPETTRHAHRYVNALRKGEEEKP